MFVYVVCVKRRSLDLPVMGGLAPQHRAIMIVPLLQKLAKHVCQT